MRGIFKLDNPVKQYEWGSPDWIPSLLRLDNAAGKPHAELWMGALSEAGGVPLASLIQSAPDFFLGAGVARRYQGTLPYLFKLLAAAAPLSIQAHPNLEQARAGFERENKQNIPLDDPRRTYKDANHKPEIVCALSEYEALCGFRPPAEIARILTLFACPALEELTALVAGAQDEEAALRAFTGKLFALKEDRQRELAAYLAAHAGRLTSEYPQYADLWRCAANLARYYPADRAIIAPFYLNYIRLAPGEALYLPAGVMHCYIHGFGVELMANSDNVIRGGLTAKYVDTAELFAMVDFHPYLPARLAAPAGSVWYTYAGQGIRMADEFRLSVMKGTGDSRALPVSGPVILAVITGECTARCGEDTPVTLLPGESAFIAAGVPRNGLTLSGTWTAYLASCGV